jgi:hypothetical protein
MSLTAGQAVTPNDTTTFPDGFRGIYVGVAGDLTVRMSADKSVLTFKAVPAGTLLPVQFDRVMATGTTAQSILALG